MGDPALPHTDGPKASEFLPPRCIRATQRSPGDDVAITPGNRAALVPKPRRRPSGIDLAVATAGPLQSAADTRPKRNAD